LFPGDIIQIDTYDVSDTAILDAADFIPGTLYGLVVAGGEWYADFDKGVGTAIADAVIFIAPQGTLKEEIAGDVVYRGLFRMAGAILVQHTGV
jgi:hypothetical protein